MSIQDKRLIDKLPITEHDRVVPEIIAKCPDAADKFVEVEVDHEPINLLQKLEQRRLERELQAASPAAEVDAHDDMLLDDDDDDYDDDDENDLDDEQLTEQNGDEVVDD